VDSDKIKEGVQSVVNEIFQQHGEVRPSILVEAARPVESPAHKGFEWNNKKAADEFRLMQARHWIRRVEIIVEDRAERLVHVPKIAYEEDSGIAEKEGYYKPISVVWDDEDEYQSALSSVKARVSAAKAAYEELKKKPIKKAPDYRTADKGFALIESVL
jgi:hypothetical protein